MSPDSKSGMIVHYTTGLILLPGFEPEFPASEASVIVHYTTGVSRQGDSNPHPSVLETEALFQLSYNGK